MLLPPPKATKCYTKMFWEKQDAILLFQLQIFFPMHLIKEWVFLSINLMVNNVQYNPKLQVTVK